MTASKLMWELKSKKKKKEFTILFFFFFSVINNSKRLQNSNFCSDKKQKGSCKFFFALSSFYVSFSFCTFLFFFSFL